MALRRPPTRVDLKPEDIDEYEELMNERMMAAADSSQQSAAVTPVNNVNARQAAKDAKKAAAAERIGVTNNARRR
ncbi:expressed unknown protein [Seminavis robusta]|uniref:Anaphase-promoting complex subunit CDC26 n=1 Tax=Seminavis robusta TaxID=568900 RepID=A0A9N8H297_9STRA|nr:expressed unknown protein [Seminavis robusta]|eukprot:Sro59_g034420.1 n/a (75) ;mRNA; f:136721-137094